MVVVLGTLFSLLKYALSKVHFLRIWGLRMIFSCPKNTIRYQVKIALEFLEFAISFHTSTLENDIKNICFTIKIIF